MRLTAKRTIGALLILLLTPWFSTGLFGATGTLFPSPWFYAYDGNGNPINGAKACFYVAGTSTPATTYSDVTLGTPNSNPVLADPGGRVGPVYLTPGSSYKLILQDATGTAGVCDGAVIRTQDNILATPIAAGNVDVTGTAGEALTAGQAVYLSDGSGSKVAGSWYKADSANAYSSVAPLVGLAAASITNGSSGTIRLAGTVTGLAVATGLEYYVGTAGALTTTAPVLRRSIGRADSSSSVIVASDPPPPTVTTSFVDDFRLSLTTATCLPAADVTAATTLYLTSCTGNRITLFDASGNPFTYASSEVNIAIPATTSQMYDVFAFASSGAPALELLAWTNDTTRATGLARTSGRWVKSGDLTRLYVGSMRTTGVSGQTEDSAAKRYVWNTYNRVRRPVLKFESTDNWSYTSTTIRQANNSTANQIDVVVGLQESTLDVMLIGISSGATGNVSVGIGEDTTVAYTLGAQLYALRAGDGNFNTLTTRLAKLPAIGRHFYAWNESGNTGNTFAGDVASAAVQAGLLGMWES